MSHPLEQRVAQLQSRIRRLLVLRGLMCLVIAGIAGLLVLGTVDYLVQFEDRGLRVILTLTLLGLLGRTCYQYLYRGWVLPLREVDLARRLERRFPELAGDLASALEFLDQPENDPTAGSVALRRAVVARATARAEVVDFAQALDRRPVARAAMVAVGLALAAGLVAALAPLASQVAVARLAYPWGEMTWPRKHYLKLKTRVDRVARGEPFEIEVVDAFGALLPAGGRIYYRFKNSDGLIEQKSEPMRRLGSVLVARRENVTRPFAYRVEGGDDRSMAWIDVAVVEPPAVASLRLSFAPPAYTGLGPRTIEGDLRVPQGSEVRLEATATKPLTLAQLRLDGGPAIPATLGQDGLRLTAPGSGRKPLVVERSCALYFELTDREGLTSGRQRRFELVVQPDAPPTATIERPTGTRFVTPEAIVPLRASAKDDLAVAQIELEATPHGDDLANPVAQPPSAARNSPIPWRITLYAGPARVDPESVSESTSASAARAARHVEWNWDLRGLGNKPQEKPAAGMQIVYRATATDYRGQSGASPWQRLVVITPEELLDRLAEQQRFLLAELGRALAILEISHRQLGRLAIRLEELGRLDRLEVDQLRGSELNQRQAASLLTDRIEGVPAHVQGLLDDLASNRVDNPDIERRLGGLAAELDRLGQGPLPEIARLLTTAIKSAQVRLDEPRSTDAGRDVDTGAALASAREGQEQVIRALERLLGELTEWDNYRRFHREIGQLLRDEQALVETTGALAAQTLGKEMQTLSPRQVAQLRTTGQDQLDLARRLDRILHEMDLTRAHLAPRDPLAAETLADALARGRRLGPSAKMRAAGEEIGRNQIAQAHERQKQAIEDLQELLDVLANRPEHELARLVRKLKEAQDELDKLAQREEGLRKRIDEAASPLEELARQQEALQVQAEQLARQLERLLAPRAAERTEAAADKMRAAGQSARSGRARQASAEAAAAQKTLDEAARELAARREQAEADLATRELVRLEDAIRALRGGQAAALEETRRLDGLVQVQGRRTEGQAVSLRQLARRQFELEEDASRLARQTASAGPFRWALEETSEPMSRAAGLLGRGQTDRVVQTAQRDALAQLDLVLEAIKPEPPDPNQEAKKNSGASGKSPPRTPTDGQGIPPVAQLKLLRLVQQDINARTEAWQRQHGDRSPPPEARREQEDLSRRQGRLADLVLECLSSAPAPEEGDLLDPLDEEDGESP